MMLPSVKVASSGLAAATRNQKAEKKVAATERRQAKAEGKGVDLD